MSSIRAPLSFVSRASSRIAVFLPSKPPASSVHRSAVSSASVCIRSRSEMSSSSSLFFASVITFAVALFAAIARPVTSPSLLSRFVRSAIVPLLGFVIAVSVPPTTGPPWQTDSEDLGAPGERTPREERIRSFDRSLRQFVEAQPLAQLRERNGAEIGRAERRDVQRDLGRVVGARGTARLDTPPAFVPRADRVVHVEHDRS